MTFDSQKFRQRLIESSLAEDDLIIGCTTQEIEHIERENDIILPLVYKEFLLMAGRGAGDFMEDCQVFYPKILNLDKRIKALCSEYFINQKPTFVFMNNNHCNIFCYFYIESSDDPAVYVWKGSDEILKACSSFTEFLESMLIEYGA